MCNEMCFCAFGKARGSFTIEANYLIVTVISSALPSKFLSELKLYHNINIFTDDDKFFIVENLQNGNSKMGVVNESIITGHGTPIK
jgi:hypothetical protein